MSCEQVREIKDLGVKIRTGKLTPETARPSIFMCLDLVLLHLLSSFRYPLSWGYYPEAKCSWTISDTSITLILSSTCSPLIASPNIFAQLGQATAKISAPVLSASLMRTLPGLSSPGPMISVKKFPPPPPQQKALTLFRRISTSSRPGIFFSISRGGNRSNYACRDSRDHGRLPWHCIGKEQFACL